LRADLSVLWLIAEDGELVERRFCKPCAPSLVSDVACAYCGDGPPLGGALAAADAGTDAAVGGWLAAHDWLLEPVAACPRCRRGFMSPGSR